MTIEDALNKIEALREKDSSQNPATKSAPYHPLLNPIKIYINTLASFNNKTNIGKKFDPKKVGQFAEHIKFGENFVPVIQSLTKIEILERVQKKNPQIHKLIVETDFQKYLPETISIQKQDFRIFPEILKLGEILCETDLKAFEGNFDVLIIPDFKFASMLISEENKFKQYIEVVGDVTDAHLLEVRGSRKNESRCFVNYNFISDYLSVENLTKFYEATGEKSIKKLFEEVKALTDLFAKWKKEGLYSWSVEDAKKELFSRLKKYHPELTC